MGLYAGVNKQESIETSPVPKTIDLEDPYKRQVSTKLVAIDALRNGVTATLATEIRDGNGLILVNINNALADVDAQYSARVAAQVAANYTRVDFDNLDIIFNVITNASIIGGESAASSMALSLISLLLDKEINPAITITGSLHENGSMGNAQGISEKARIAKKTGSTHLLIPPATDVGALEHYKLTECGVYGAQELCVVTFASREHDIGEELGITLVEISTIDEALEYYLI